jgi:hypothetical protein
MNQSKRSKINLCFIFQTIATYVVNESGKIPEHKGKKRMRMLASKLRFRLILDSPRRISDPRIDAFGLGRKFSIKIDFASRSTSDSDSK